MPPNVQIRNLPAARFATEVAQLIVQTALKSIAERGLFRLALAGGDSPAAIYSEVASLGDAIAWERVQITYGDERCVPPEDAFSNYRMSKLSLLDRVPIPSGNVFRIRGELDPAAAATEYEHKLSAMAARLGETRYVHDLVLLGLGPDGHTASLFPGSAALEETERNLLPVIGPKPPPQRITMTFPLLNAARQVWFLVNDPAKQGVIDDIAAGRGDHPAGRVRPVTGSVTWLVGTP